MVNGPGQAYSSPPALLSGTGFGPMVNPSWLAATADRERTAGTLRAGFAEGRLSQDELEERIARAYAARTYADLWALTADLPIGPCPFDPFGYGPQVAAPPGVAMAPDDAEASNWQSAAALLITALVIFTLAALVTAIVTAHVQPGLISPTQQPGVIQPFQPVHLAPYITANGSGRAPAHAVPAVRP